MSIGERIADLRKKRNISQVQLAGILDVSRQAVSKWENDLAAPDTIRLIQLADVLDTNVEYLATGKDTQIKTMPQVITVPQIVERAVEVEKIVEVERIVEVPKVIEKPVYIEKIVEVEKPAESVAVRTETKEISETKYMRDPIEFVAVGAVSMLIGILIGMLL